MVRALQLGFTIDLLTRNYRELRLFISRLGDATDRHLVGGREGQWKRHEGMREVVHLLHNFVASASTLIDHTRIAHKKLYEPHGLMPEYSLEVRKRFATDPLSQFVIGLRQMAQHYRLPSIKLVHSIQGGGVSDSYSVALQLTCADLLEFSSWTAPAQAYITLHGDQIDISLVASEYHAQVIDFYDWFSAQQEQIHGSAPSVYARLVAVGWDSPENEILALLEANTAGLESIPKHDLTYDALRNALSPALTISDMRLLLLCEHDAFLWVDEAFRSIQRRFPASAPLYQRVRRLVSSAE